MGEKAVGTPKKSGGTRRVVYCLVPRELAAKLHEPLCRHFRDVPSVEVVIERRVGERRRADDRRSAKAARRAERRLIRNPDGRRVGERRAALAPTGAPALPRRLARHADRLTFVERIEPSGQRAEDLDTARLVTRIQAGDREAFGALYLRYFNRVWKYMRTVLKDVHQAEDLAQDVFTDVLSGIDRYERRGRRPFRAWLFTVARNHAASYLERSGRIKLMDPAEIAERQEAGGPAEPAELSVLNWISNVDLQVFVEQLPLSQRQVLVLRYMVGLSTAEIARVLGLTPGAVRKQQSRALALLKERLEGVGRTPEHTPEHTPERPNRVGSRVLLKQSTVLRTRRFGLGTDGGAGPRRGAW